MNIPGWWKNRGLYRAITLLFLLTVLWQASVSIYVVEQLAHFGSSPARPFFLATASNQIDTVTKRSQDAGLRVGDRLVSIAGEPYRGESQTTGILAKLEPGQTIAVGVRRAGSESESAIQLPIERTQRVTNVGSAFYLVTSVITPAFCLLVGFGVVAARPRDRLAWLLLMLMLSFAQMSNETSSHAAWQWDSVSRFLGLVLHNLFASTWGAWILLFGIYFPERVAWDRRLPWLKWLVIIPIAASAFAQSIIAVGESENVAAIEPFRRTLLGIYQAGFFAGMIAISGFFMSLGMKHGSAASADAKRRLTVLEWGAGLALTPLFFVALYGIRYGWKNVPEYLFIPGFLLLAVFPLTLAYVIVVQRAMDVRMLVRQGLRYALATRGVRVLQGCAAVAVIWGAIALIESPSTRRPQKLTVLALSVVFVFRIRQGGTFLGKWVDRRFFREAYSSEQILSELGEKVRSMVETGPLLETVARQISQSLHVNHVAMLLNSNGHFQPAYAIGYGNSPAVSFEESDGTIEQIKQDREPLKIYPDDRQSWIYQTGRMNDVERGKLQQLDSQLLLPLSVKQKLLGIISLGPKRSEEPYSKSDVQLLESVAAQTGLALENSYLTQAIASEVAQRERMNRELEIAREVQERLFPQTHPEVPGVDYAGRCRPALGVGGDYYDFIELPNGNFGVAIGDVSGKGIPAALLMACLQASLRGQTISGTSDLASLMGNMNRLIFNATPSNRYATFFYAQYEPALRRLTYVNAGHNPPMLFRRDEVIRLEEGGPIVGLFKPAEYTQASLLLEPSDVLVLFTDGISESMNAQDDEWGEDALAAEVQQCNGMSLSGMIDRLMKKADEFAAGAPQHDDMTIVLMRVT